ITLSIGLAALDAARKQEFQVLVDEAAEALEQARAAGGNRLQIFQPPPPRAAGPAATAVVGVGEQDFAALLERLLHEKLESIFASQGQKLPDFGNREKEVVALAVQRMEEEHKRETAMLQRRLEKV